MYPFSAERPLREYEFVSEVAENRASQSSDYFLLRRTELASYLSIRSVPTSSPALAGYVYLQDRKKKWSKRWLELRDHSLYHGKSDKGKDQELLCHTSSFDAYLVQPSTLKTPKAHAFALRSQDSITLFEKPDQDYVHFLCLSDPAAHRDWVKNIINARTYVLKQERAALFRMAVPAPAASSDNAVAEPHPSNLSRSNTKSASSSRNVSQPSPLLDMSAGAGGATSPRPQPLIGADAFRGPFEKGSLLADVALKTVGGNGNVGGGKPPAANRQP
jgi:PH domain